MSTSTILDLLRESINSTPLGVGREYAVFAMPGELRDTVLRIKRSDVAELKKQLNSTTALTSSLKALAFQIEANVGQALFEGDVNFVNSEGDTDTISFALHKRVNGVSYDTLFNQLLETNNVPGGACNASDDNARRVKAHKARVHILADMPQESYDALLRSISVASAHGVTFDFIGDNFIMDVDKETMGVADAILPADEMDLLDQPGDLLKTFITGTIFTPFFTKEDYALEGLERSRVPLTSPTAQDIDDAFKSDCQAIVGKFVQALENTQTKLCISDGSPFFLPFDPKILRNYCGYEGRLNDECRPMGHILSRMRKTLQNPFDVGLCARISFLTEATTYMGRAIPLSAAPHELRALLHKEPELLPVSR